MTVLYLLRPLSPQSRHCIAVTGRCCSITRQVIASPEGVTPGSDWTHVVQVNQRIWGIEQERIRKDLSLVESTVEHQHQRDTAGGSNGSSSGCQGLSRVHNAIMRSGWQAAWSKLLLTKAPICLIRRPTALQRTHSSRRGQRRCGPSWRRGATAC